MASYTPFDDYLTIAIMIFLILMVVGIMVVEISIYIILTLKALAALKIGATCISKPADACTTTIPTSQDENAADESEVEALLMHNNVSITSYASKEDFCDEAEVEKILQVVDDIENVVKIEEDASTIGEQNTKDNTSLSHPHSLGARTKRSRRQISPGPIVLRRSPRLHPTPPPLQISSAQDAAQEEEVATPAPIQPQPQPKTKKVKRVTSARVVGARSSQKKQSSRGANTGSRSPAASA